MKICQVKRKYIKNWLFFSLIIISIFLPLNYLKAINTSGVNSTLLQGKIKCDVPVGSEEAAADAAKKVIGSGKEITTLDVTVSGKVQQLKCIDERGIVERALDQAKTWSIDNYDKYLKHIGAVAFKAAAKNFLNNIAYDTATYLATGDWGQGSMFETRNFGRVLSDAADNAAGTFIQEVGKGNSLAKFNLCTPDPKILLKINLGLNSKVKPKAPACTFSQMTKNWDTALKDKNFLPKFQDMFNPWSNDLGIALTLQTGMETEINKQANLALEEAKKNNGIKDITDPISKFIKSPGKVVVSQIQSVFDDSTKQELTYTGDIAADAIDVFVNTLAGRLLDKWLKKGLVTNFPEKMSSLTDIDAQNQGEGISGAEDRFRSLIEPNFKVRGDYDILGELTMCPDPNKAGPTNCVIDEKFRQAIEKRLTVKQAMDQGYLNANGVFGFTSDGLEPRYNEGYPYRSMLILRKFRIIPVGWETAAQKIKDKQSEVGGTKNLSDLINCKAAWCAGLVDPNWVLKAPQNFCAREGAGPEILSEQISGESTASSLNILRNDTYCADEQSVIKERNDGSNIYGYCTEERRVWDFNGKSCEPRDNTCQTFQLGDQTVSYLQNTLDYGSCNAGNAGCQKYATGGTYANGTVNWNGNNSIYLNKNAEACEAADEGCHGFIRITPNQNETYGDIKTAGVQKAYERFSSTGLIYEKILPDYLKNSCYSYDANGNISDGRLLANAPAKCQDFARECKAEEAGCELYTNIADGSKIPAKVNPNDYCVAECVGYNTFIQQATNFDSSHDAYFIPKTAKACSAEAVGCDQFTNLDEIKKGGEGIEYYTGLRQCLKKSGNEGNCAEFYSWEGSDESGYQLRVESLKSAGAEPTVTENDSALCTKDIYNLLPSNPAYNADCRQFYNRGGGISYHLYSRTFSCSDDCHPYRKTVASDDTASSCKGGGVWNDAEKACVYMAIPGQGATCSAAQAGCREYTGNTGNDVRNIFTDDFSGGTTNGWVGVNGSTAAPSSEALALDSDNKGNSLSVSGGSHSASRQVGNAVTEGKSYVLNFVVKAVGPADLKLSLTGLSGRAEFSTARLTADWQIISVNLASLNHKVAADEILLLEAGNNFYIDNITLTEIVDRYYLIKNSWQTPASCDQELDGTAHDYYMLGCGQYTDRANRNYYLKSFSELCSESAVGCELMIDTKNSTAIGAEVFNGTARNDLTGVWTRTANNSLNDWQLSQSGNIISGVNLGNNATLTGTYDPATRQVVITSTINCVHTGTVNAGFSAISGTLICNNDPATKQNWQATIGGDGFTVPADEFTYVVYDQSKLCNAEAKGCALLGKPYKYETTLLYGDVYLKNNPDKYSQILCSASAVGCQAFTYDKGEKYFKDP
ncbi:MAG: carbohydrate binding domain-containing protein, partial [Patescibacteria group bacterium]|nr:carbohydrate binding domain-containing protein [Patescibacteria group bacterium]